MCGICGVISFNSFTSIKTHVLKNMNDSIAHRGPDDAGYLLAKHNHDTPLCLTNAEFSTFNQLPPIDSPQTLHTLKSSSFDLFLGHRRLSILDCSVRGHQPMGFPSRCWISYNGEIYNFKELKNILINENYIFHTETDTEVILHAYAAWGIELLKYLNGMFAFGLWDQKEKIFYLARDRYGIKPLYYTILNNGQLIFASEIKAILAYLEKNVDLDYEALLEYFTFQNLFTDKTLYANIKLLPAGHYLKINLNDSTQSPTLIKYWDFHFREPEILKSSQDYLAELKFRIHEAVKRQLVSDVEIASFLSGGIDSGSITAIAAKYLPSLKTFTIGFDLHSASGLELGLDERKKAEYLSYLFKTEHYEMVLKAGDMERCLGKFAWHLEEPRVGQSYPNYYASQLASKFVKVVLAGTGGDELFAGYPWRYYRHIHNNNFEDYIDKYYLFWQRLVDNSQLKKIFSPIWDKVSHVWTRDIFRQVFLHHAAELKKPEDYINHSLYFEAKTFLHGLLVVEDKLSMAHSLETRVPYLDNDLVDFAMELPLNLKLGNLSEMVRINENLPGDKMSEFLSQSQGKLLLRQALAQHLPETYTEAKKRGFSSPDASWFKGDSIEYVRKKIINKKNPIYHFFDFDAVTTIVNQHLCGEQNKRLFIWSLLNFSEWCTQFN